MFHKTFHASLEITTPENEKKKQTNFLSFFLFLKKKIVSCHKFSELLGSSSYYSVSKW